MKTLFNFKIDYFLKCAEAESFSQAARILGISQSAVSTAIKKLEEDFGTILFERGLKGIKLTPAGTAALNYLQVSRSQVEQGLSLTLKKKNIVPAKIGVVPLYGSKFLFPYIEKKKDIFPPIHLYCIWSADSFRAVQMGYLDFAFVSWTSQPRQLSYVEIQKDRQAFIGSRKHFPNLEKTKTREEVELYPLVRLPKPQLPWQTTLKSKRTEFLVRDSKSAHDLVIGGYAIGELQVDTFSDQELESLAISRAPVLYPNGAIYLIYRDTISEASRQVMNQMVRDLKRS